MILTVQFKLVMIREVGVEFGSDVGLRYNICVINYIQGGVNVRIDEIFCWDDNIYSGA